MVLNVVIEIPDTPPVGPAAWCAADAVEGGLSKCLDLLMQENPTWVWWINVQGGETRYCPEGGAA